MAIAISVLSAPSKSAMIFMAIVSPGLIGVGAIALLQLDGNSCVISATIAIVGIVLAVFSAWALHKCCRKVKLTISNNGQMRLLQQRQGCFHEGDQADVVQMMPGSTLWSFFILLRLRQQNKKMIIVPFFWGSLSPQHFRRLSVACRWIAARNDVTQSHRQASSY